jgi:hypothetical protein
VIEVLKMAHDGVDEEEVLARQTGDGVCVLALCVVEVDDEQGAVGELRG